MLFKDQCVSKQTISGYTETDTTITSVGYRIKVDSVFVTEMRVFRNVGSINVPISCENLISFSESLFEAYLLDFQNTSKKTYLVPSATKTVAITFYTLVFTKATGETVATAFGENTMNNVINGRFGNYFSKNLVNQSASGGVFLTNKYISGKTYHISENTYDVLTVFAISTLTVQVLAIGGAELASASLSAGMNIVSLNYKMWWPSVNALTFRIKNGSTVLWEADIIASPYIDNLMRKRGTCYVEEGETKYNLFVHHPWGGLDSIGTVNAVSISGSANRDILRLDDIFYIHGGSANDFETPTQSASVFSIGNSPIKSEGTFSMGFESYISNVDELWISAMSGAKKGFLVADNMVGAVVAVNIDGISASQEVIEGDERVWKLSINCTQQIPFRS